ncbi:hypothetical protein ElyMa_004713800 [Elysia marginata]|uniref:Ig-like domain-containing protein n=1 Tax=Elysia marginata TaxID=1093978 RepID=A0AAV4I8N6_9GAST|nr:hypothetical protein ElyMa_004713800 [Elysia marginata]
MAPPYNISDVVKLRVSRKFFVDEKEDVLAEVGMNGSIIYTPHGRDWAMEVSGPGFSKGPGVVPDFLNLKFIIRDTKCSDTSNYLCHVEHRRRTWFQSNVITTEYVNQYIRVFGDKPEVDIGLREVEGVQGKKGVYCKAKVNVWPGIIFICHENSILK